MFHSYKVGDTLRLHKPYEGMERGWEARVIRVEDFTVEIQFSVVPIKCSYNFSFIQSHFDLLTEEGEPCTRSAIPMK